MSLRIRYMGTKHNLAGDVRDLVADLRPERPILDLFCGMCSVAGAVSSTGRPVWGNDVQRYAALAARCMIATPAEPPDAQAVATVLRSSAERNECRLVERFASELDRERAVLEAPTVEGYQTAYRRWRHAANDPAVAEEAAVLRHARGTVPYRLATITFAWGYFGLRQAIAIDSLRYAIDRRHAAGDLGPYERRWALLALLQAASLLATGPGHLAQYLSAANPSSLERVVRQRRRDMTAQFGTELGVLEPYGTAAWRRDNVVMCRDAVAIWPELAARGFRGNVIYADPPYSKNQYSRFYHVLETLHRYDYPPVSGRGRYRSDRFHTGFSTRRGVGTAFDQLCGGAARLNCALVLSYPSNGLLIQRGHGDVESVLRRHFGRVELALRARTVHSTLGAAHGRRDNPVDELVYVAVP
jgi:adenine-specific DNA-methyltransferase